MAASGVFTGDHEDLLQEFEEELRASDDHFNSIFGDNGLDINIADDHQDLTEVFRYCIPCPRFHLILLHI